MPKRTVIRAALLGFGLMAMAACGSVSSVAPQWHSHGQPSVVQKQCNVPQSPVCGQ